MMRQNQHLPQPSASLKRWAMLMLMCLCCALPSLAQKLTKEVEILGLNPTAQKTCRGDARITVVVNNPKNRIVSYQLLDSEKRILVPSNPNPAFRDLSAGTYYVRLVSAADHNEIFDEKKAVIKNNYVALDRSSIIVTSEKVCGNFRPEGTIIIDASKIKGGTPPFQFSIIKHESASYSDALSRYSSNAEKTVTEFGRYQVRVKDACDQYETITYDLAKSVKAAKIQNYPINNQPCASGTAELFNIGVYDSEKGGRLEFEPYSRAGGVKLEIRDKTPTGSLLFDGIIKDGNHREIAGNKRYVFKLSPTNEYWARVTTPCGDVWEGTLQNDTRQRFSPKAASVGCPGGGEGMQIKNSYFVFGRYPATVKFINISKKPEVVEQEIRITSRDDQKFESKVLPFADYRVEVIPDCGKQYGPTPVKVYNVKNEGAVKVNSVYYDLDMCDGANLYTKEHGTTGVTVLIQGFYYDQINALARIVEGPSNVGVYAYPYDYRFRWYNMKPGHYKAEIVSCGFTYPVEFDVNPPANKILQQEIVSTATSKCSGGGSITSAINYNGSFSNVIEVLDEDGNPVLDSKGNPRVSTSGQFTNLDPGTYYTRIRVAPWCDRENRYYYVYNQAPLVITNASVGPQIKSFMGVACEDLNGAVGNSGAIYLQLSGTEDAKLEYRKKGDSKWKSIAYKNNVKIEGLEVASYEVRLSSCGQSTQAEVKVKPVVPSLRSHIVHPCLGNAYRLSIPYYTGAIYAWYKNGVLISNGTIVEFEKFKQSDNGAYTCKVQWGGCVTRIVTYHLNANLCGEEVGEVSLEGTVFNDANGMNNGAIDGTPIFEAEGKQLYIQVLMLKNGSYEHVGTRTIVGSNGRFQIGGIPTNQKYRLILTTSEANVSAAAPIQRWVFTGEYYQNTGSDGQPDGMLDLTVGKGSMLDLRFGLKRMASLRSNRHITTKM